MSADYKRPDEAVLNGVGRDLRAAFAPDSPVDPELRRLIRRADGKGQYLPDEAADQRADNLLDRLKHLPWGNENGVSQ